LRLNPDHQRACENLNRLHALAATAGATNKM
jgi:hypothetical protein